VIKAWDIVIIGGGLGGLALAAELAAPQFSKLSVLVIEKSTFVTALGVIGRLSHTATVILSATSGASGVFHWVR
jgi:2-polyprenyl-6-methoxyphenol hydroxylase-like FAD-dependent oxidoreductase